MTSETSLLTHDERETWKRDGYLHLKGVLREPEIAKFEAAIEDIVERPSPFLKSSLGIAGNDRDLKVTNVLSHTSEFDDLLDHPAIFGKILCLMGPYLQVAGTEVLLRRPHNEYLLRFHTDGGTSLRHIFPDDINLPIQFKVQFFLTDVSQADSGNFMVIPGSHKTPFPERGVDWSTGASQAVQILARAGDAIIFPWTIWHAVAPNRSGRCRKTILLRYAQLWCRPADYVKQSDYVLARMSPRRRRLLGSFDKESAPSDYYRPASDHCHLDIILGSALKQHPEFQRYAESEGFFYQPEGRE